MKPEPEAIYNLFLFVDDDIIENVGLVAHEHAGTDEEKLEYLKFAVESDLPHALRFPLPARFKLTDNGTSTKAIDYATYRDMANQGYALLVFEEAFHSVNASKAPLMVITPVRDGQISIEGVAALTEPAHPYPEIVHVDKQPPWYQEYIDDEFVHLDQLINDDFLQAARLLFQSRHYVSSMKLLMICIDTISYLEFGDVTGNFSKWVAAYMDLSFMEITPEELWEFRNSILHMTNLDSRKVQANKVRRLMFYVAAEKINYLDKSDEGKYFRFKDLIDALAVGISNWAHSYDTERKKFESLFDRYDRIISDKRMTTISFKQ